MSGTDPSFQLFDPDADLIVTERRLPHWAQSGAICFLTWRTWDSMPAGVLAAWLRQRSEWLRRHGIDPRTPGWNEKLLELPVSKQQEFHSFITARWESCLDACHGQCVLRRRELAKIVADSLLHFDGDRYIVSDFVVMPNHVHVLAAFRDAEQMLKQCHSWKHYTATQINRILTRRGRFWEVDGFDHLVRTVGQYEYLESTSPRIPVAPG